MAGELSSTAWQKARARILADHPQCAIRGDKCTGRATTVDHIVPRSKGGSLLAPENLRPACGACNYGRGDGTRSDHPASRPW